eukprot:1137043-Pelagomonas_calceolata.AAC.2
MIERLSNEVASITSSQGKQHLLAHPNCAVKSGSLRLLRLPFGLWGSLMGSLLAFEAFILVRPSCWASCWPLGPSFCLGSLLAFWAFILAILEQPKSALHRIHAQRFTFMQNHTLVKGARLQQWLTFDTLCMRAHANLQACKTCKPPKSGSTPHALCEIQGTGRQAVE